MRQSFRERREHLHRGIAVPRPVTMLLMLAIMGLVFLQLRNPGNWRLFGSRDNGGQVAQEAADGARSTGFSRDAEATANKMPPKGGTPTKPPKGGTTNDTKDATSTEGTDLDPEEMEDIKPSLSVLYDGSTETMPAEQPAYFQILGWVDHQSAEALRKRATRAFFYDTLVKSPDTMRLQIVEVKLAVRQIVPVMGTPKDGKPQPLLTRDGSPIYEVRGVSQESGSNLYFGIVTDLPPGTPVGTLINEDARLVGYFFKVQGYVSQQQQLDFEASRTKKIIPLKAPLIVGRLIWLGEPAPAVASNTPVWILVSVGGITIILVAGWVYWSSRRKLPSPVRRITVTSPIDPDALPVDNWLDLAQSGRFSRDHAADAAHSEGAALDYGHDGRFLGNIFDDNGESYSRGPSGNGHTSVEGNHSPNGSAGTEPEVRENEGPASSI